MPKESGIGNTDGCGAGQRVSRTLKGRYWEGWATETMWGRAPWSLSKSVKNNVVPDDERNVVPDTKTGAKRS